MDSDETTNQIKKIIIPILTRLQKENVKPTEAYRLRFFQIFDAYNSKQRMSDEAIQERYIKEIALIIFFKALLKRQNPQFNAQIPYLSEYYSYTEAEIEIEKSLSISEIIETYILATEVVMAKKEKYFCEYYTPIEITELLVNGVKDLDIRTTKRFLDPCCGPGTILTWLLIRYTQKNRDINEINRFISESLFGYDILPFSAVVSILQIYTVHQSITKNGPLPKKVNISIRDSLKEPTTDKFDYIITNPPYKKTFTQQNAVTKFRKRLRGHTNTYLLFLLWALDSIKPNGRVSFLLPQTLRVGEYNHNFRKYIGSKYFLNRIVIFQEKTNVFQGVEQKVMIVDFSLRKSRNKIVLEFCDRHREKETTILRVNYSEIRQKNRTTDFWVLPTSSISLRIIKKIQKKSVSIEKFKQTVTLGVGTYVWNQHKEELEGMPSTENFPVIYANSIKGYWIEFPFGLFASEEKKEYSRDVNGTKPYNTERILIKRTIDGNKRLVMASLLEKKFINKHGRYFLENHVAYMSLTGKKTLLYKPMVCYLNSRIISYYYAKISATAQLSRYELVALPVNWSLIRSIRGLAEKYYENSDIQLQTKIDQMIYNFYKLTPKEVQEVEKS